MQSKVVNGKKCNLDLEKNIDMYLILIYIDIKQYIYIYIYIYIYVCIYNKIIYRILVYMLMNMTSMTMVPAGNNS